MLSGAPIEVGWDCYTSKAIVFYEYLSFLADAILEASPKPGVDVTRDIYGGCSDEVIPVEESMSAS
jgi:hypothetical protein